MNAAQTAQADVSAPLLAEIDICRFSYDVAKLNLRSATRHVSQREYFLKLFFYFSL